MAIISHLSALEYWGSVREGKGGCRPISSVRKPLKVPPRTNDLENQELEFLTRPIHMLVSKRGARRMNKMIANHYVSVDLPKGFVWETEKGLYVCSPELCFIQMAGCLELILLIELGFMLCGTYDVSQGIYRKCEALTSVEKLQTFVDKANGLHGTGKARRALKYRVNGSASPMETKLTMLLCLPHFMGGYGIAKPELNYRVDLDVRARRIAGKKFCRCDLYCPRRSLRLNMMA